MERKFQPGDQAPKLASALVGTVALLLACSDAKQVSNVTTSTVKSTGKTGDCEVWVGMTRTELMESWAATGLRPVETTSEDAAGSSSVVFFGDEYFESLAERKPWCLGLPRRAIVRVRGGRVEWIEKSS